MDDGKSVRVGVDFVLHLDQETIKVGSIRAVYDERIEVRFADSIVQYDRINVTKTWFFYDEYLTSHTPGTVIVDLSRAQHFFSKPGPVPFDTLVEPWSNDYEDGEQPFIPSRDLT